MSWHGFVKGSGPNHQATQEDPEALGMRGGKRRRKCLLIRRLRMAATAVGFMALVMGAAAVWWQQHSQELLAQGQVHREKGLAAGHTHDEDACLRSAVDALGTMGSDSFGAGIAIAVELDGCLETSRPTPGFCDGVPAPSALWANGLWIAHMCQQAGHGGNTACNTMAQRIAAYCGSVKRFEKTQTRPAPTPAAPVLGPHP